MRRKRTPNKEEEDCKQEGERGMLIRRKRNVNKEEEECK